MSYSQEDRLANDFPIFPGYLYVVDGRVTQSEVQGTVLDLKRQEISKGKTAAIVTRCNIKDREIPWSVSESINYGADGRIPMPSLTKKQRPKSSKTAASRKRNKKKNHRKKR